MQADFREGEVAHLSGGTIHECFKYKISEGNFDANSTTIGNSFYKILISSYYYDIYKYSILF